MRVLIYLSETLSIAFGTLRTYKMRSILTTLGIVIGVTTVIAIVAIIQGLNQAFADQISTLGSDTLYISKFPWMMQGDEYFQYRNRKDITMREFRAVESKATYLKAVAPTVATMRTIKHKDKKVERSLIFGSNEDYLITSNAIPEYGRFINELDVHHNRMVCVIGYDVAKELFGFENPIGKRVNLGGYPLRIIGILEKRGKLFGFNMDIVTVIPIGVFQKAFGSRRRSVTIEAKVLAPELLEDAEGELTGIMRRVRKIRAGEENDFAINQQSMLMNMYNSLTSVLYAVMFGVGSISLLVGGIGIMNIMLVSVAERTREIGVRKALGARKSDILLQFLVEAILICSFGVIIGVGLAIALASVIAAATPVPAAITPWVAVLGISFAVTIGIFFGVYPASKAAKLDPIEALRYE